MGLFLFLGCDPEDEEEESKTSYTVTFDANGGNFGEGEDGNLKTVTTVAVEEGKTVSEPKEKPKHPDAKKELNSWYLTKNSSGDPFKFASTPINTNMTLYAKWTLKPVKAADKANLQKLLNAAIAKNPKADLNHIDTSKITDMANLFKGKKTFNGKIDRWDTSKVTDMSGMFYGAAAFDQNLSSWKPIQIDYAKRVNMFVGATKMLAARDKWPDWNGDGTSGGGWQPPARCEAIEKTAFPKPENITPADPAKPTWDEKDRMSGLTALKALTDAAIQANPTGSLNYIDTSAVTNMYRLFYEKMDFNGDIDCWNTSEVTEMLTVFGNSNYDQDTAFNGDIGGWNTSKVTDMSYMFYGATNFNRDLNKWDTSKVTKTAWMFRNAKSFNGNISTWDTSSITDANAMFRKAKAFKGDISKWNTSNIIKMNEMFVDTAFNGDISKWDTSKVEKMQNMFLRNSSFNGDISQWNTSNVLKMDGMFGEATAFTGVVDNKHINRKIMDRDNDGVQDEDADGKKLWAWDTSSVRNMDHMFSGATAFNSDIGNWKTSEVRGMISMFKNASRFNRNLNSWVITNLLNDGKNGTFAGSGMIAGNKPTGW